MNISDFASTNIKPIANPDMELELLGMLTLKNGQVIPKVASILKPDDFYSSVHKIIYQTILNLYERGIVPNMLTIYEDITKHRDFKDNEKIFKETVLSLGEVAFTTAYAEGYANTIKEKSIRRELNYLAKNLQHDIDNPAIDTNKLLTDAESALRTVSNESAPPKLVSRSHYLNQLIIADIGKSKNYANRKTGFWNIDNQQIFSPGLYVLGATPACGKTTFAWQLLEQLAANGEFCIFCSYEMSRLELFSKSLARELFIRDRQATLTAADIRSGSTSKSYEEVFINLANDSSNDIKLLELRDESIDDLLRILKPYCSDKDKSPIVCLDYLQIVPVSDNQKLNSDKARIDSIVHKLKSFQRETNTTFIVVSSFNRMNYFQQVSFESFKESGNIEYTADVIWALQLNIVNQIKIGDNISSTRKKFEDAKKSQPRQIQLKCLKNRQGNNYDCFFDYYSAHDFFEPCDGFIDDSESAQIDEDTQNMDEGE